jgi:thioredoxin 1
MRIFRTVVYTILILGITTVLVVKHNRRMHLMPAGGKSPATIALAEAQDHRTPAWLLIHSDACSECQEMRKVCRRLEPEFEGKVRFVEVEFDDRAEQDLMRGYNVRLVPTSVFIRPDGQLFEKKIGAMTADQTKAILNRLLGK